MDEADLIRIRHMLDAATEATAFANGKARVDLESDRMLVLALLKDLEIVGESLFFNANNCSGFTTSAFFLEGELVRRIEEEDE